MNRGAWRATVHQVAKSWSRLSDWTLTHSGGSVVENLPASAGDPRDKSSIPGVGRSLREGNSNPLQYSCLENLIGRAWCAAVHGAHTRIPSGTVACTLTFSSGLKCKKNKKIRMSHSLGNAPLAPTAPCTFPSKHLQWPFLCLSAQLDCKLHRAGVRILLGSACFYFSV